jgi:hypothetical protein
MSALFFVKLKIHLKIAKKREEAHFVPFVSFL